MEKNKTVIDIKPYLKPPKEGQVSVANNQSMHSNPIFKKFLLMHNKKVESKFSLKDLFR